MGRDFNDSRCSPTRGDSARLKQIAEGIAPQPLAFPPGYSNNLLVGGGREKILKRPEYRDADSVDCSRKSARDLAIVIRRVETLFPSFKRKKNTEKEILNHSLILPSHGRI